MPLALEAQGNDARARLDGELTVFNVADIYPELLGLLEYERVTLDLSELIELDGCGAQLLAILQIEAQREDNEIVLQRPTPAVARTLHAMCMRFDANATEEY